MYSVHRSSRRIGSVTKRKYLVSLDEVLLWSYRLCHKSQAEKDNSTSKKENVKKTFSKIQSNALPVFVVVLFSFVYRTVNLLSKVNILQKSLKCFQLYVKDYQSACNSGKKESIMTQESIIMVENFSSSYNKCNKSEIKSCKQTNTRVRQEFLKSCAIKSGLCENQKQQPLPTFILKKTL
uniref:Uncharacterized protein n=1 Tax=Glossina palpalis gambiensis TaxID=67801 RepID=A0A1B0BXE9_9MUSC